MTITATDIQQLEASHIAQTYRRLPVVLTRGQGSYVYDLDGQAYLDLISGIGVASLGHANPRLAEAIREQAGTLLHTSNLYFHPLQGELARRLHELSGLPRAFFCNSGGEAVEACLKFARRYWHTQGDARRVGIVALEHSFHGRTLGALSVTWEPGYRRPFAPLLADVTFVSPRDPDALSAAVSETTQAVILEPIQGEGGVRPLSAGLAEAVAERCRQTGALLIADEVQCGLGRTGHPFYSAVLGLRPDLVAVGKALGGGVPIGAALMSERVATALAYGDHGSTYGGNLLACRAALVFLEELLDRGLLARVGQVGARLGAGLRELGGKIPGIKEVRGAGLMWGIDVEIDAAAVVEAALRRRLLVNRTGGTVIRLLPPLTIGDDEVDLALAMLADALGDVAGMTQS